MYNSKLKPDDQLFHYNYISKQMRLACLIIISIKMLIQFCWNFYINKNLLLEHINILTYRI